MKEWLTGLVQLLTGLHTGNGEAVATHIDSMMDAKLAHLQGATDSLIDRVRELEHTVAQLRAAPAVAREAQG